MRRLAMLAIGILAACDTAAHCPELEGDTEGAGSSSSSSSGDSDEAGSTGAGSTGDHEGLDIPRPDPKPAPACRLSVGRSPCLELVPWALGPCEGLERDACVAAVGSLMGWDDLPGASSWAVQVADHCTSADDLACSEAFTACSGIADPDRDPAPASCVMRGAGEDTCEDFFDCMRAVRETDAPVGVGIDTAICRELYPEAEAEGC